MNKIDILSKINNTNMLSLINNFKNICIATTEIPKLECNNPNIIINKGTGGSKKNCNGKKFEDITNNKVYLLEHNYIINSFSKKSSKVYNNYLSKTFKDKTITFVLQNGFKIYMKNKYNIDIFRYPDEAYIIEYNTGRTIIKILEKKEQNVEGSVETKLWASPSLKREYELILGNKFEMSYGLCVNKFLQNKFNSNIKKYILLNEILNEHNIIVLFGDDNNYFDKCNEWINN